MDNNLISICYEGTSGETDIRTLYIGDILYFSLSDVFVLLNKENRGMGETNPTRYIPNLIKSQISDLDDDEYKQFPHPNPSLGFEYETFVTQPGLNRVMGSDGSPAGRKFQRWLYHDVVPSLTKHGFYPPPLTPQGSALSQMAEILAQNSRALADSIVRQDKLEKEVNSVKGEIVDVQQRVDKLENSTSESDFIITVRNWFDKANIALSSTKEFEIVTWCEHLSLRDNKPRVTCPSGKRLNAKFFQEIIPEAKSLVERARG